MRPTLNRRSALQRFICSNAIEIRNGITFDFYLAQPQIAHNNSVIHANTPWSQRVKISDFLLYMDIRKSAIALYIGHFDQSVRTSTSYIHWLHWVNTANTWVTLSQYITTWYHTDTECMNILHTPGCKDSFFQSAAWYLSATHTADQLRSWRTWNWLTQEEPEHTHGRIHTHSVLMSLSGLCSLEYVHKERDVDMQSFYKHKFPAQHKMVWPVRVASFPGSPLGTRL